MSYAKANEISLVVAGDRYPFVCAKANGYTVSYGTVSNLYHYHLLVFLLEIPEL